MIHAYGGNSEQDPSPYRKKSNQMRSFGST